MPVTSLVIVCATLFGADAAPSPNGQSSAAAAPLNAHETIIRSLKFLQDDVVKWRKEHECATCHHGTLTVWVLSEARERGFAVKPETLAEIAKWTKAGVLARIDLPRDARPGWSVVSTPALYLAAMARSVPSQTAVSPADLKQIAGHLLRHQEADGSWSWASAPAKNRAPPVFESDEVATLLALDALGTSLPGDPMEKSAIRIARAQGAAWLKQASPHDTTQAAALRLVAQVWDGPSVDTTSPVDKVQTEIESLIRRANSDGGWPQIPGARSDAYATGQALYILSLAGEKHDRIEMRRGVQFLVGTQRDDGSWLMTRRGHPGVTPTKEMVPITYFGSVWGTLGLLRATQK